MPDAVCIIGEWVAALMLGRVGVGPEGRPPGCGVPGAESRGAGCRVPSRLRAAAGAGAVRAADVSGKPAPGTFMN